MCERMVVCSASPESARGVASSVLGEVVKVRVKMDVSVQRGQRKGRRRLAWPGFGRREQAGCVG